MQTFADRTLSQRLERAEAAACARFAEARAQLSPATGAAWIEVSGAYAVFDGIESPITQTFGLGMFDAVSDADLSRVEGFFRGRGAPVYHEISPLADLSLFPRLHARGYEAFEFTSVMFREIAPLPARPDSRVTVRRADPSEHQAWAAVAAEGWSEFPELAGQMLELGRITAARAAGAVFFAELEGRPIAAGALSTHGGVALLAGASTIPSARRNGAQLALLDARLRYAAAQGCDLAMMCALPGSGSQRNAERNGFRIAYTRTKWRLR
jgi:GNAT superfamily N-acetyltransferase